MRKLLIIFLSGFVFFASAQQANMKLAGKALKKKNFNEAISLIDQVTSNEETKNLPDAWFLKGQIYQAIAADTSENSKKMGNAVVIAWDSYSQAKSLDATGKINKKIDLQLFTLSNLASNKAYEFYQANDMENAFNCYDVASKCMKSPVFKNVIDTAILYYTGIIGVSAQKYEQAIPYLKEVVDLKYGGASAYIQLKNAYFGIGDTLNGKETLIKALNENSNDLGVLIEVINYYISSNIAGEALVYIKKAKEKDPKNISLLFVEGTIHEKVGDKASAIESYRSAIAIDSTYFNAQFNMGVLYYNSAKDLYDQANSQTDDSKYMELKTKADSEIANSEPYMLKAYQIADIKDKAMVGEALRTIYIRLNKMDQANKIKGELEQMPK